MIIVIQGASSITDTHPLLSDLRLRVDSAFWAARSLASRLLTCISQLNLLARGVARIAVALHLRPRIPSCLRRLGNQRR
jgi:hypothetical protein